ncbi:hypothetical protein SEA_DAUBENSKI_237 [Streptomyces phage Daubenski]|uniref:Uncharacterized protein n=1 Tax=Streptomyces phage Daubenski TaxID=2653725 RepID=A0A5Q2WI02_9CAUD|nr:hypothetical protein KNU80_gp068 [Streptomyces phage Daubenski]QGH76504.1 hypothetical protein SEA_DAUBENSKI_237 [Streptomyces phage Daubenski]
MSVLSDIRRMAGLPDAEVSSRFAALVDGYVRELNDPKNNKGNPGMASQPSRRVGKIRRKKGQLIPSQILFAMRESLWKMGWTQGVLRNAEGHMCLRGAAVYINLKGYAHNDDLQIAIQYLHDEVRSKNGDARKYNFIYWNNESKRTLAEILKILEDCGNRAKLSGE